MQKIILASGSPRRKELLGLIGISYEVHKSDADETVTATEPEEIVKELSARKAWDVVEKIRRGELAVSPEFASGTVLGADTIVWKDELMGKPVDHDDAYRMLNSIRGTFHYVVTGVALIDTHTGTCNVLSDTTEVWCKNYTDADILDYISREEPYDKAGSYAIQGYFGRYIDHIDGDYENVVGLPYYRIEPLIQKYL
jgi:septum formation protein